MLKILKNSLVRFFESYLRMSIDGRTFLQKNFRAICYC